MSDDDPEFLYWEATADSWICPHCITGEEQHAIDEADMATDNEVVGLAGHCARCWKTMPGDDPGDPLPAGWAILDSDEVNDAAVLLVLCPDCIQPDDELLD